MKSPKYNILYVVVIALFLFAGAAEAQSKSNIVFSNHSLTYWIDGTAMAMDTAPVLEQGRVFIPVRYLGYALGLQDRDMAWDETSRTVTFYFDDAFIRLTLDQPLLDVNGEQRPMDVAPLLIKGRVYLPASFIAAALGYVSLWDEVSASICINPATDWQQKLPKEKTPDPATKPLAVSELLFPAAKDNNVYNAGVAAKYIDGKVLKPGELFSYNQVVGIRSKGRGFIQGQNVDGEPENGGGVCRTSTVVYQAAQRAGFKITERHPHVPPVWYTPVDTDATVVWGAKDLKFVNNSKQAVIINCGLEEKKGGGFRLYAEILPYQLTSQLTKGMG